MRDLRVVKLGELVEDSILSDIYVATVEFDLAPNEHPNHTRVYCVAASPIENSTGFFEKFLATLKNADLAAYDGKIPGMSVKVTIFSDLSLSEIRLGQLGFDPAPSPTSVLGRMSYVQEDFSTLRRYQLSFSLPLTLQRSCGSKDKVPARSGKAETISLPLGTWLIGSTAVS